MKVYVVSALYEDYFSLVVKVFGSKEKAESFIKEAHKILTSARTRYEEDVQKTLKHIHPDVLVRHKVLWYTYTETDLDYHCDNSHLQP